MRDAPTADERIRTSMASRSPAERLRMCARMFAGAKTLARAGMAEEHRLGSPSREKRIAIRLDPVCQRDGAVSLVHAFRGKGPGLKPGLGCQVQRGPERTLAVVAGLS